MIMPSPSSVKRLINMEIAFNMPRLKRSVSLSIFQLCRVEYHRVIASYKLSGLYSYPKIPFSARFIRLWQTAGGALNSISATQKGRISSRPKCFNKASLFHFSVGVSLLSKTKSKSVTTGLLKFSINAFNLLNLCQTSGLPNRHA